MGVVICSTDCTHEMHMSYCSFNGIRNAIGRVSDTPFVRLFLAEEDIVGEVDYVICCEVYDVIKNISESKADVKHWDLFKQLLRYCVKNEQGIHWS